MKFFRDAPLITKGSLSRKKLGHQVLHSILIYREWSPTSCRKRIFNSLGNNVPHAESVHFKTVQSSLSSWEQSNFTSFCEEYYTWPLNGHMDIKASLVQSEVMAIKTKESLSVEWLLCILHSQNKASSVLATNFWCMSAFYLSNCLKLPQKNLPLKSLNQVCSESVRYEGIGRQKITQLMMWDGETSFPVQWCFESWPKSILIWLNPFSLLMLS